MGSSWLSQSRPYFSMLFLLETKQAHWRATKWRTELCRYGKWTCQDNGEAQVVEPMNRSYYQFTSVWICWRSLLAQWGSKASTSGVNDTKAVIGSTVQSHGYFCILLLYFSFAHRREQKRKNYNQMELPWRENPCYHWLRTISSQAQTANSFVR